MSGSGQTYKLFAILLISVSQTAWADETTWPQLDNASSSGICSDALKIASAAYRSDNFYLYELPPIPQDIGSAFVLQPSALDISGGDALIADASVFKKIPKNNNDGNSPPSIYWQTKANHGFRYVMNEDAFGWRGDQYTLFAIKEEVTPEQFIAGYSRNTQDAAFSPLIEEGWRPPLMMQEKSNGNVWAIDVGAPYVFLSDWHIHSIGEDGAKQHCTIHFHPEAKTVINLLPASVRKLAALLDGTLGSGENEGTLQQTARMRINVMHTWANVGIRPWAALRTQPYNSRQQVDDGLKKWSRKAKTFNKLYQNIYSQYPKAEHALVAYYKTHFNKNADEASAMAKQTLDIAFRTYFVFPK